jgi:hypothetical protein
MGGSGVELAGVAGAAPLVDPPVAQAVRTTANAAAAARERAVTEWGGMGVKLTGLHGRGERMDEGSPAARGGVVID